MRRPLATALALALAGLSAPLAPVAIAAPAANAAVTTQLPRNVRPTHYDVAVVPHAQSLSFDGRVTVAIDVLEPTTSIVLNAAGMAFSSVSLTPEGGKAAFAAPKVALDADAQTATFTFDHEIPAGSYTLSMAYTGRIGTQANGLFAIDYDTEAGKRRALYTQFENSDARKFIPSWDEPSYKATFDLQATVPAGEMAVSNMPVASREDAGDGLVRVRFATSPKMSTYLLFFGLGDFDRATAIADGTEVGVVTQKGKADQAAFALESAQAILHEYNDYFGVPYPLPKLDNIASPGRSQFFGAMENWGAIYTFEYALLLDPSISTQSDRQSVFSVAAHEMAHQWFGDLVTMTWWDDLWLNEGFASWMEGRTTAKLHPEWNTALSAVSVRERAMARDAVATTHPVVQHVETVEQASQAFDAITYSKGEAVIRMLEDYVGADAWREGVRRYIKAHAYGNTQSDDLWHAIESAAGKPITAIAHDFTLQPGVPLVKVESADCDGGHTTLRLSQGEFTRDRPGKQPLSWRVPVIAQAIGGEPVRTLVEGGKATLEVPGCGPVVVNAGQAGYYRTLYTPAQFAALRDGFAQLAPIDQLGLMNGTWALGMEGLQPASSYLDLAAATPVDADPQVWGDIVSTFGSLDGYYRGDATRQARFRAFAVATLEPVLQHVGWEAKAGEAAPVAILREDLIDTLGDLGDPAVVAEARRRHAAAEDDPSAVPPALRKAILGVVARHADAATWDALHAAAQVEKTPLVKDELYGLLSSTEDEALARRALELALTDEPGATNSAGMIERVARLHPELAFDFALAHRERMDQLVDTTSRSRYYPALARSAQTQAMADKVRDYADRYIAKGSRRPADTAIAGIANRIQVREQRLPEIDAWLQQRG
jgi:aminopeptidase N